MTEASRMHEILRVQDEAEKGCERQMGDHPNTEDYMGSYAAFVIAHALSLVALELNHLNTTLWRPRTEDK